MFLLNSIDDGHHEVMNKVRVSGIKELQVQIQVLTSARHVIVGELLNFSLSQFLYLMKPTFKMKVIIWTASFSCFENQMRKPKEIKVLSLSKLMQSPQHNSHMVRVQSGILFININSNYYYRNRCQYSCLYSEKNLFKENIKLYLIFL